MMENNDTINYKTKSKKNKENMFELTSVQLSPVMTEVYLVPACGNPLLPR